MSQPRGVQAHLSKAQLQAAERSGQLDLHGQNLPAIPEGVYTLATLMKLDLSGNDITFIPKDIARLQSLQLLNLDDNRRLADLPKELALIPSLRYICLQGCNALPSDIAEAYKKARSAPLRFGASARDISPILTILRQYPDEPANQPAASSASQQAASAQSQAGYDAGSAGHDAYSRKNPQSGYSGYGAGYDDYERGSYGNYGGATPSRQADNRYNQIQFNDDDADYEAFRQMKIREMLAKQELQRQAMYNHPHYDYRADAAAAPTPSSQQYQNQHHVSKAEAPSATASASVPSQASQQYANDYDDELARLEAQYAALRLENNMRQRPPAQPDGYEYDGYYGGYPDGAYDNVRDVSTVGNPEYGRRAAGTPVGHDLYSKAYGSYASGDPYSNPSSYAPAAANPVAQANAAIAPTPLTTDSVRKPDQPFAAGVRTGVTPGSSSIASVLKPPSVPTGQGFSGRKPSEPPVVKSVVEMGADLPPVPRPRNSNNLYSNVSFQAADILKEPVHPSAAGQDLVGRRGRGTPLDPAKLPAAGVPSPVFVQQTQGPVEPRPLPMPARPPTPTIMKEVLDHESRFRQGSGGRQTPSDPAREALLRQKNTSLIFAPPDASVTSIAPTGRRVTSASAQAAAQRSSSTNMSGVLGGETYDQPTPTRSRGIAANPRRNESQVPLGAAADPAMLGRPESRGGANPVIISPTGVPLGNRPGRAGMRSVQTDVLNIHPAPQPSAPQPSAEALAYAARFGKDSVSAVLTGADAAAAEAGTAAGSQQPSSGSGADTPRTGKRLWMQHHLPQGSPIVPDYDDPQKVKENFVTSTAATYREPARDAYELAREQDYRKFIQEYQTDPRLTAVPRDQPPHQSQSSGYVPSFHQPQDRAPSAAATTAAGRPTPTSYIAANAPFDCYDTPTSVSAYEKPVPRGQTPPQHAPELTPQQQAEIYNANRRQSRNFAMRQQQSHGIY